MTFTDEARSDAEPQRPRSPRAATLVLSLGALAVVLAGARSPAFELEAWLAPKELALGLTGVLLLPWAVRSGDRVRLGVVDALLLAFVVWSAISAALATNRWLALASFGVSLSGLLVYAAARRLAARGQAPAAVAGLAFAVALGAGLGVAQAYGLDALWVAEGRAPGGTFGNRNFLAHLAAIGTPLLLLVALRARPGIALLGLLGVASTTAAIVLTRSRAAWLGLAAALGIMALAALMARGRPVRGVPGLRPLSVVGLMAVGAIAAVVLPNQLRWRSEAPYAETLTRLTEYRTGSGRGRLIQYRNTARMTAEAPLLGVGPGNWFVHYPRFSRGGDPSYAPGEPLPTNPWPSSDWMALVSERGVVGVLLLAFAGLGGAVAATRRLLLTTDEGEAARAMALLGVLAAAVVTGLFDAVLLLAAPTLVVWSALGLLLPPGRALLDRELAPKPRVVVLVGTMILALGATVYAGLRTAAVLVAEPTNRSSLALAARLDPGGHRTHLRLAHMGPCSARVPYARAAAELMPHHAAPREALRACGAGP